MIIGNKTELIVEASIRANDKNAAARKDIFVGLAERAINDLFVGFPAETTLKGPKAPLPKYYRSAVQLTYNGSELQLVDMSKAKVGTWYYWIWDGHVNVGTNFLHDTPREYHFKFMKEIEPLGDDCPTKFLEDYPEIYLTAVTSQILKANMEFEQADILDKRLYELVTRANRAIAIREHSGKEEIPS